MKVLFSFNEEHLFHAQICLKNGTQPIFIPYRNRQISFLFVPPHSGGMEIVMRKVYGGSPRIILIFFALLCTFLLSSCAEVTFDAKEAGIVRNFEFTPTLEGHVFGGWFYDDGSFDVPYSEDDEIKADVTVYAKWIPLVYTVTFEIEGDTVTDDENLITQNVEYGKLEELP